MKNPVTTIIGVIQIIISLIAALFPNLFGFAWGDADFQTVLIASLTMVGNGIVGLINIFKAADTGGGV